MSYTFQFAVLCHCFWSSKSHTCTSNQPTTVISHTSLCVPLKCTWPSHSDHWSTLPFVCHGSQTIHREWYLYARPAMYDKRTAWQTRHTLNSAHACNAQCTTQVQFILVKLVPCCCSDVELSSTAMSGLSVAFLGIYRFLLPLVLLAGCYNVHSLVCLHVGC